MKAKELDKKFDEGKNILEHLDISKARRPDQSQKRVNVDFPLWMIRSLDTLLLLTIKVHNEKN